MKSKFAFGMFAGFALACLFFFFFLFFFPSVFRVLAAKKSPRYDAIGYSQSYTTYPAVEYGNTYVALAGYWDQKSVDYQSTADYSHAIDYVPTTWSTPERTAYAYKYEYEYEYSGTPAAAVTPASWRDYSSAS